MNTQEQEHDKRVHVVSDEDWKQRVKAEDAALDQKLKADAAEQRTTSATETAEKETAAKIDPAAIPPADLSTLISMFSTQAMVSLGILPNPANGQTEAVLPLARHFIDLLGVLEEKTKGNLDEREAQLLESALHELRMAYLEKTKSGA